MKKGFTLLELIIVIIIIGILVAIALPQFTEVAERARAAKAKGVLDIIRKAETIYFARTSIYTADENKLIEEVPELNNVDDIDWSYNIPNADNEGFIAQATRQSGDYDNNLITLNQLGQFGGDHPFATK